MEANPSDYQRLAHQSLELFRQGRFQEAEAHFERLLADHTYAIDFEYDDWLRSYAQCLEEQGRPAEAGLVYTYLHHFDMARQRFIADKNGLNLAMLKEASGHKADAARQYRKLGFYASAALTEPSDDLETSQRLIRDLQQISGRPDIAPNTQALAELHLGRTLLRTGVKAASQALLTRARTRIENWLDHKRASGTAQEIVLGWRIYTIASELLDDAAATEKGYACLADLHLEQGLHFQALRFREAQIQYVIARGDRAEAAHLYQDTARRFANPRFGARHKAARDELTWRAADALFDQATHLSGRTIAHDEAERPFKAAADLYASLGDVEETARCYREIAALQRNPEHTERAWQMARDLKAHVADTVAPRQEFPQAINLTRWLDLSLSMLRIDEYTSNIGRLLRDIIWNLELSDVVRRQALLLLLEWVRLREPGDDFYVRLASMVGHLSESIAAAILKALLDRPSEEVHVAVMRVSAQGPSTTLPLLEQGLRDIRANVRMSAIEALQNNHYPQEALSGLRDLYIKCACVGGKTAVLKAMTQCNAPRELLLETLRALPRDPRVDGPYKEALNAALTT